MWLVAVFVLLAIVREGRATQCDFPQSLCFDSEVSLESLSELETAIDALITPPSSFVKPSELETLVNSIKSAVQQPLNYETCRDVPAGSPSGLYLLRGEFREPQYAYCDMQYSGGGWLVFQNRFNGQTNFQLTWTLYQNGFGNMQDGEFWWGLDKLYRQTNIAPHELAVVLEDFDGVKVEARYSDFQIGDASENYRMNILGTYSGTAGDSMFRCRNMMFSTSDRDNDIWPAACAVTYTGAWWYSDCHDSNLNGQYLRGTFTNRGTGMTWKTFREQFYSVKTTRMLIRKKV
ncbi:ficolin-2-like [Anopheles ziemanni]|uniref:ficolin-2-like n=1 Tax=Anopheles coustani TaxID=139045 RepID=UPI0026583DC8|nr:ficolin-2-like [Anopheles coustani]XP_058178593.1 ficolin-2-like [Anopheles ziemanni]